MASIAKYLIILALALLAVALYQWGERQADEIERLRAEASKISELWAKDRLTQKVESERVAYVREKINKVDASWGDLALGSDVLGMLKAIGSDTKRAPDASSTPEHGKSFDE